MECELKYDLGDEAAYRKLLTSLGPADEELRQRNVYFDGGDTDGVLRLRSETNGKTGEVELFLTYKHRTAEPSESGNAYFKVEEYEVEIGEADWQAIYQGQIGESLWDLEPLARLAEKNGRDALPSVGEMENLRLVYSGILPDGAVAEIDRTRFPGNREDFELEVETENPDPVIAWLSQRFAELGLELRPQAKTKYGRFKSCLKNLG